MNFLFAAILVQESDVLFEDDLLFTGQSGANPLLAINLGTFRVEGDLTITDCNISSAIPLLQVMQGGLFVDGNLNIQNCGGEIYQGQASELYIGGDFLLTNFACNAGSGLDRTRQTFVDSCC